ncbi:hypothetical protein NSDW_12020 [Novosphingobium olei]|nr:hypothetical protein NSDW_12020 [Novosphingobium olei]
MTPVLRYRYVLLGLILGAQAGAAYGMWVS